MAMSGLASAVITVRFTARSTPERVGSPTTRREPIGLPSLFQKMGTGRWRQLASGGIYTLLPPPLSISDANNKVSLFWTTNEIDFGLQQNTNLAAANWVAVTNEPVVANTFYQVSLPATNHPQFFRLVAP
jgi:hypothetical protein